jgi:hypothetical protein
MAKASKATTFSSRSNAKRAAEKAIATGTAPSLDYGIKTTHRSGRFQIIWKDRAKEARERLGMPPTTEHIEAEIATATAEADTPPSNPMPAKPVVTSKANPHYQARFDKLEAMAMAGDWDSVRAYEVKGINSYAKMVAAYRDRLLAAHAASAASDEAS